jgi:hypothetical protein
LEDVIKHYSLAISDVSTENEIFQMEDRAATVLTYNWFKYRTRVVVVHNEILKRKYPSQLADGFNGIREDLREFNGMQVRTLALFKSAAPAIRYETVRTGLVKYDTSRLEFVGIRCALFPYTVRFEFSDVLPEIDQPTEGDPDVLPYFPPFPMDGYRLSIDESINYLSPGSRWIGDNRPITSSRVIMTDKLFTRFVLVKERGKPWWKPNGNDDPVWNLPGGSTIISREESYHNGAHFSGSRQTGIAGATKFEWSRILLVCNPIYNALRECCEEVFGVPEDLLPEELWAVPEYRYIFKTIAKKVTLVILVGRTLYLVVRGGSLISLDGNFEASGLPDHLVRTTLKWQYFDDIERWVDSRDPYSVMHKQMREHIAVMSCLFEPGEELKVVSQTTPSGVPELSESFSVEDLDVKLALESSFQISKTKKVRDRRKGSKSPIARNGPRQPAGRKQTRKNNRSGRRVRPHRSTSQ